MATIKQYKICRRLGVAIYEKCQSPKFVMVKDSAKRRRRRPSDFGLQLLEKQKVRFMYGVSEKQFSNYVNEALVQGTKEITPAKVLFQLLESRLDNVVYRMGMAKTRRMARQLVSHGHFMVNDKRTKVPSYRIKEGDTISVREGSKSTTIIPVLNDEQIQKTTPAWVTWDNKKHSGQVTGIPTDPDPFLNFQSVVEFYSR